MCKRRRAWQSSGVRVSLLVKTGRESVLRMLGGKEFHSLGEERLVTQYIIGGNRQIKWLYRCEIWMNAFEDDTQILNMKREGN